MKIKEGIGIKLFINDEFDYLEQEDLLDQFKKEVLIESLVKDISNLLNARQPYQSRVNGLNGFLINYGLANLDQYSAYSEEDQRQVADLIKSCILEFEPRLQEVLVTSFNQEYNYSAGFHYKITATLNLKQDSIPIEIESKIDTYGQMTNLNLIRE